MLSESLNALVINAAMKQYWRVRVVELTASTQVDLVRAVRQGNARAGDVIVAEYQTAGRGRLVRSFIAPKSTALLFSFYIEPKRNSEDWGWIPLIVGASVAKLLSEFGGQLKWPNDILIKEKKVSGIISEVIGDGIVIGVGINVAMSKEELPVPTATSLFIEGAHDLTRNQLLIDFLTIFREDFTIWESGDNKIAATYLELSATLGREVRVVYPDGRVEISIASSLGQSGELVLANGTHVHAGDIVHLR